MGGIFLPKIFPKIGEVTFDPKPVSYTSAFSPNKPSLGLGLSLGLIKKILKAWSGKIETGLVEKTGFRPNDRYSYVCHAEMNVILNKNCADARDATICKL